jgi:hypothetical protein
MPVKKRFKPPSAREKRITTQLGIIFCGSSMWENLAPGHRREPNWKCGLCRLSIGNSDRTAHTMAHYEAVKGDLALVLSVLATRQGWPMLPSWEVREAVLELMGFEPQTINATVFFRAHLKPAEGNGGAGERVFARETKSRG